LVARYRDTLFTEQQVRVLRLRAQGLTLEEIARRLGISKTSAHSALRGAMKVVERARNTLRLYVEILGGVEVKVEPGVTLDALVSMIFREADIHGIKIRIGGSALVLQLFRRIGRCIDAESSVVECRLRLWIGRDGLVRIMEAERPGKEGARPRSGP